MINPRGWLDCWRQDLGGVRQRQDVRIQHVGVDVLRVENENQCMFSTPVSQLAAIPAAGRGPSDPGRQAHANSVVRQAENWARARYRGPQAVTGAVAECGIPESSLKRRSATATGSTVIGCVQSNVQNIRIEEAKRLLESEHVFFPKQ